MKNLYGIMIKYPEPGKVKTRLARDIGEKKAAEVYRQIAEKIMKNTNPSSCVDTLTKQATIKTPYAVIPAKAGIQCSQDVLDCQITSSDNHKEKSYYCHSGLPGIFLQKDSRQAGVTDDRASEKLSGTSKITQIGDMAFERIIFYDPPERLTDFEAWFPGECFMQQRGGDVGARMDNAIRDLLPVGAGKAVITGADIPDLSSAIILEAFAALDHADIVLGPAKDGGYYLIGMKTPHPEIFRNIPWSTGRVFEETMTIIEKLHLNCKTITTLSDLDTADDYERMFG